MGTVAASIVAMIGTGVLLLMSFGFRGLVRPTEFLIAATLRASDYGARRCRPGQKPTDEEDC